MLLDMLPRGSVCSWCSTNAVISDTSHCAETTHASSKNPKAWWPSTLPIPKPGIVAFFYREESEEMAQVHISFVLKWNCKSLKGGGRGTHKAKETAMPIYWWTEKMPQSCPLSFLACIPTHGLF